MSARDAERRLLQLGEYLTQRMLVVDGVDSAGDQFVRARRKATVKYILATIERLEGLRAEAKAMARAK